MAGDKHMLTWIFITTYVSCVFCTLPHRRFEYKLSFKGPHLIQRDGTIPFWDIGGRKYIGKFPHSHATTHSYNPACVYTHLFYWCVFHLYIVIDAIASDESIRVTPSLRSKRGMVFIFRIYDLEFVNLRYVIDHHFVGNYLVKCVCYFFKVLYGRKT